MRVHELWGRKVDPLAPVKRVIIISQERQQSLAIIWVAVKELKLSYYIGGTLSFTIYIYIPIMVTQSKVLNSNPVISCMGSALAEEVSHGQVRFNLDQSSLQ